MGRPCSIDLAMTGEISLTGKVLPVGGIKEKIMAARRAAITKVVLPASNKRDYEEIADYLKDGLSVYWADDYSQVYEVAFGSNDSNSEEESDGRITESVA
jgi:ATP-dependent Lon protease